MKIRPKTNNISTEKSASAPIWHIFRPKYVEFVKRSSLFSKETGEVLDTTYAQPLDARERLRMHQRPGGSKISASEQAPTQAAVGGPWGDTTISRCGAAVGSGRVLLIN